MRGQEERQMYQVYDKELQLVDTIGIPYATPNDGAIGDANGFYFFKKLDEGNIVLAYFDKSTIGSFKENDFTYQEVAAWKYANADLEE